MILKNRSVPRSARYKNQYLDKSDASVPKTLVRQRTPSLGRLLFISLTKYLKALGSARRSDLQSLRPVFLWFTDWTPIVTAPKNLSQGKIRD
jgi:hypothetical protein